MNQRHCIALGQPQVDENVVQMLAIGLERAGAVQQPASGAGHRVGCRVFTSGTASSQIAVTGANSGGEFIGAPTEADL